MRGGENSTRACCIQESSESSSEELPFKVLSEYVAVQLTTEAQCHQEYQMDFISCPLHTSDSR